MIINVTNLLFLQSERAKVDEIRGNPMAVGTLEEMIDDNHAIVSSSMGPEYYVNICSFVNKDLLEPGSSVLLHNKVHSVIGILPDDADPMVSVMKVEKAPLESYADIGGLQEQVSANPCDSSLRRRNHQHVFSSCRFKRSRKLWSCLSLIQNCTRKSVFVLRRV